MTSATTRLPFTHEHGAGINRESVDTFLSLTSETIVLTSFIFPKHLALSRKNRNMRRKEKVGENEAAGTPAKGGGMERQSEGEGGMVFVNPSTSGFY